MKMRKLLAGVVAAALAATTLATAAFADFTKTADSTSTAYSYSITQTYTFAKSNLKAITVGRSGDPMTSSWGHSAPNYSLKTIKVNGFEVGKGPAKLVDGLQNSSTTFIGKEVSSIVVEYVYDYDPAVSTEKQDIAKDMGYWAQAATLHVTTEDGVEMPLESATTEFFSNTGDTTTTTSNTIPFRFTLAEQAAIKNGAVATIKLGFEATTADVEMIKVTVLLPDEKTTQTVQTAVMKGATSAEIVIPSEYLYDADYGTFIKSITVGAISSKLTSNVVEFTDGTVVDDTDDDTDADDVDDEDDVDADDVDDADDTDADLDDTDDVDADDTDDTDSDSTDADADNAGDADDTDSADGDKNVPTGVALAVVPAAVAAAAAIVAKKRK